MDDTAFAQAQQRADERLRDAADGRPAPAELEAALERARLQVEALAQTAGELQTGLPDTVGIAVREGVRAEALPVARQLAEVRGLAAQTIRRLERLETDLLAERNARVDDLGVLVDLISSGWHAVDERLRRIEQAIAPQDAQVIRLDAAR
jgi:hypothetical protein